MNNAYIDGANLHKGVESSAWRLDYQRFRSWIRQKFNVGDAHLFIGLMPKYASLYTALQDAGYKLVFKEIIYDGDGRVKGNCDADLVLHAVRDYFEKELLQSCLSRVMVTTPHLSNSGLKKVSLVQSSRRHLYRSAQSCSRELEHQLCIWRM